MLSEPATGSTQAPAVNSLTRTWKFVPSDSLKATKGTPPTLAMVGLKARLVASTLTEPAAGSTQPPGPSCLTRIWFWLPSDSDQATHGTPPNVSMLGLKAPWLADTLSDPATGSFQFASAPAGAA